jgi:hypothetical protein
MGDARDVAALMQCPKCKHVRLPTERHVHAGICPACGIAYAKWRQRQSGTAGAAVRKTVDPVVDEEEGSLLARLRWQLSEVPDSVEPVALWGRTATLIALALWAGWFVLHGVDWEIIGGSFLHNANLAFHEFGHVLFRPFGDFMMILGGSLFQILLPLMLAGAFAIHQRDNFAAAVMLWWCGQNFVDVAPYISDAEYRVLPLVGGAGEESHDWGNLLTRLEAIDSCYAYGRASFTIGAVVMLVALAWGVQQLLAQRRQLRR